MKKTLPVFLFLICSLFCLIAVAQTTYTWKGGTSAAYTTSTNWNPTRTTPATNDILVFDGNNIDGANGTGNIIVTSVATETIGQLTLQNIVNVSLSGSAVLTVNSGLSLGGFLALGNNDLVINNSSTSAISVTSPDATKMVAITGTGQLKRLIGTSGGIYLFPIGEITGTIQYSPVSLNFSSNSTNRIIGVKVTDAKHPSMDNPNAVGDYLTRYWTFSENSAGGTYSFIPTFTYITTVSQDVVGTVGNIRPSAYDGVNWIEFPGSASSGSLNMAIAVTEGTVTLNGAVFTGRRDFSTTTYTWTGAIDNDWTTDGNWDVTGYPNSASHNVIIDPTVYGAPVLPAIASGKNIIVGTIDLPDGTSALTLNGTATLTANESFSSNGTIILNNSSSITALNAFQSGGSLALNNTSTLVLKNSAVDFGLVANFATGSTVNFNVATTVPSFNYGNLVLSASTGTYNVDGDLAISGNYSQTGASTFLLGTGSTLTINQNAVFTVGSGATANFNGKSVTIRSGSAGNGAIGNTAGTISNANNVTVERYIPAKRAWRLLAAPVTGTTINAAWQEGLVNTATDYASNQPGTAGYGTHITGGTSGNGFDQTATNSASIRRYSSGWLTPSSTSLALQSEAGWMLFVRGDRTINLTQGAAATPTNTVLRATGTIRTGTQSAANIPDNVWTLTGNPYPSNIDFEQFAATTNLAQDFYVWDANINGTYGVGQFILVTRNAPNSYSTTPIITNGATLRYIQSGQAFFLKGDGGTASLAFAESHKTASSPTANVYRTSTSDAELMVSLNVVTGGSSLLDGLRVKYNPSFSKQVTSEDVTKMLNFGENISSYRSSTALIIERRPDVTTENDTVFLRMTNMGVKSYSFDINLDNFATGLTATLEDAFLSTSTPLNITGATTVNFDVTSTTGSAATNRFRIVFRPSTALPLSFTSIKAYQAGGNKVQVDWNVASESGINNYEVERSTDGRSFTKFTTTPAKENAGKAVSYGWMDQLPVSGSNYYRVKSVAANGEQKYTAIVKVTLGNGGVEITIYPNPVKGNTFNLQLTNLEKGSYTVKLYNAAGQTVMTRTINHTGGSSSEQLTLPNAAKGVYQLEVTGENGRITHQLLIQ